MSLFSLSFDGRPLQWTIWLSEGSVTFRLSRKTSGLPTYAGLTDYNGVPPIS